jgi:hypothetical protein
MARIASFLKVFSSVLFATILVTGGGVHADRRRKQSWRIGSLTPETSSSPTLGHMIRNILGRAPQSWISSLNNTNAFECDLVLFSDDPRWPTSAVSLRNAPYYSVARSFSSAKVGNASTLRVGSGGRNMDAIDVLSRSVMVKAEKGRHCLTYFLFIQLNNLDALANEPKLEFLWASENKKFLLLSHQNADGELEQDLGKPDFFGRHWKLKEPHHTYVIAKEDGNVGKRFFELLSRCKFCGPFGEDEYTETHYKPGDKFSIPEVFEGTFNGARLVLGTKEANPYVYMVGNDNETGALHFDGLFPNLVQLLSRKLNFTYEYVLPPDNEFGEGVRNEDGELDGLLGMVNRREVDFTATAIPLDGPEHAFMDFTYPLHVDNLK